MRWNKSNRALLSFFFLFFGAVSLNAQVLNNKIGSALDEESLFHPFFVSNNQIHTVVATHWRKEKGKAIERKKNERHYEFDQEGYCVSEKMVTFVAGYKDTLVSRWHPNKNKFTVFTEKNKWGTKIDSISRTEEQITITQYRTDSETGIYSIVNKERWECNNGENTELIKKFNQYDLPYQMVMKERDSNGYLTKESQKFVIGGQEDWEEYDYNERGWVSHRKRKDGKIFTYKYDDVGNLVLIEEYAKDILVRSTDIVYNDRGFLESTVTGYNSGEMIDIVKYSFVLWN